MLNDPRYNDHLYATTSFFVPEVFIYKIAIHVSNVILTYLVGKFLDSITTNIVMNK